MNQWQEESLNGVLKESDLEMKTVVNTMTAAVLRKFAGVKVIYKSHVA